jgi:SAM-dependent methyltransferase
MRVLDLGCGWAKEKGAIGVERVPLTTADVVCDLADFPYPFANNSFDKIILNDVIEHLPDTIKAMEEVYRLCAPNAQVLIRVINWNSHYNAMDPTHVRQFHEHTFHFFGTFKDRAYYSNANFEVVKVDKIYSEAAQKFFFHKKEWLEKASYYLNNVLETLHFELKAIKPESSIRAPEGDLSAILRCPHCVAGRTRKPGPDPGQLKKINASWFMCVEEACNRKYPIYEDLPQFFRDLTEEYRFTDPQNLKVPATPADFSKIRQP